MLTDPWATVWRCAVQAKLEGNYPIGAAIVDLDTGKIVSSGVNRLMSGDSFLRHAEICAFDEFTLKDLERPLALYVSTEPCPMCFGAANVARVKELHFASYDPWAGSAGLTNWYTRWKTMKQFPPAAEDHAMEVAFVALMASSITSAGRESELSRKWQEVYDVETIGKWWRKADPNLGESLYPLLCTRPWEKDTA